jgi:hypothetical protein
LDSNEKINLNFDLDIIKHQKEYTFVGWLHCISYVCWL